jgi:hypothetical protein
MVMADTTITIGSGPAAQEIHPPSVYLSFPEKGEVQPVGFGGLELKSAVTVVLTGKVKEVGSSSGEYGCKTFSLEIESCRIDGPDRSYKEQQRSLGEAVDNTRKYVETDASELGPDIM